MHKSPKKSHIYEKGLLFILDPNSAWGAMNMPSPCSESLDLQEVARRYTVRTTPFLDRLIQKYGEDSPLARQFRPAVHELVITPEERSDPIGDYANSPLPGLVHRYADRVLLKITHVCAAYCRFCFRREMIGPQAEGLTAEDLDRALSYIHQHKGLREVILTGGDPFLLSPRRLRSLLTELDRIPHIQTVRFHTRLPVHDPERISDDFVHVLAADWRTVPWVAVHVNHPDEFAPEVRSALARMAKAGIPLVSQTVLLKGVNDDVTVLEALFRACLRNRVKPYYLHHPDLAKGTSHFRLSIEEGRALMRELRDRLTGLALPHYILDRPGGKGKVPVGPRYPEDWPEDRNYT